MDLDIDRIESNLLRRRFDFDLDLDGPLEGEVTTKLDIIHKEIIVRRFDTE